MTNLRPLTTRELTLIEFYSGCQLAMTPQRFRSQMVLDLRANRLDLQLLYFSCAFLVLTRSQLSPSHSQRIAPSRLSGFPAGT